MNNDIKPCEQLLAYMSGDLTENERNGFSAHLANCPECAKELRELEQVWLALPDELEDEEMPAEWKEEILGSITGAGKRTIRRVPQAGRHRWRRMLSIWTAAIILILGTGSWWIVSYRSSELAIETPSQQPAQIITQYKLKSFDQSVPAAKGEAWLMQQGEKRQQLILQTTGLPVQTGEEAYQVWLVKNGERSNCGTFKVNNQGDGVITYMIRDEERGFDTIGITLEPDAKGSRPRGKKMLGT
jgi:hypothetical protein